MSLPLPSRQTVDTRRFFDSQAANWSSQYKAGGHMADRIGRFADGLSNLGIASGDLLDFGCGAGDVALGMAGNGWQVTGCDISPGMIETASARTGAEGVNWLALDPAAQGKLPFADASFDAVVSSSVFEYVTDPARQFTEIARVLRPGGAFLLTVPDMRHAVRQAEVSKQRLARIAPLMALLRLTPWGPTYDYLRLSVNRWPSKRWAETLAAAGLTPEPAGPCVHPLMLLSARR